MGLRTYLAGRSGLAGAMILYCLFEALFVVRIPISRRATFSRWMSTVCEMWLTCDSISPNWAA